MDRYDPEKFRSLIEQYESLHDKETDDALQLLARALSFAPPEIREAMRAKMHELEMFPPVLYVDSEGQPVFTSEQLAKHFGMTIEEVEQKATELMKEEPGLFRPNGEVHRLN